METVEFQATVKDGVIEIPSEYREGLSARVRVILLPEESEEAATDFIGRLLAHPIRRKGFRLLSRGEAHAR